jgi:hypothetical protein
VIEQLHEHVLIAKTRANVPCWQPGCHTPQWQAALPGLAWHQAEQLLLRQGGFAVTAAIALQHSP